MILYKKYFLAKGSGEDLVSDLNAFDVALESAGISECNLVPVSSILAEGSKELEKNPGIKIGEVVHCVLARADGTRGQTISAGIACVVGKCKGKRYGLVMEAHGSFDEVEAKAELEKRIEGMVKLRAFSVEAQKLSIETIRDIKDQYGCVISAVVYR